MNGWLRVITVGAQLGAIGCAISCGARTDLVVSDRSDAGPDARTGPASCELRCEVEPIAVGFPIVSSRIDVARAGSGWLIVQGDERARQRLHMARVVGDTMTSWSIDLPVDVQEPRLAMNEAPRLGVVVFRGGLLWIDAEGAPLGDVVATGPEDRRRGGRPFALDHDFLIWTGDHAAGSMDRGLESASIAPLSEIVRWEPVPDAAEVAGLTPDFERHGDDLIGAWTVFTRRQMFVAWMDGLGRRRTTLLVHGPEPAHGWVDRFENDIAVLDGRVAALRATARPDADGRPVRVLTLDVFEEDGHVDFDRIDTPIDPDRYFKFLEVIRHTVVAVYDHEGTVRLLPLLGDCADPVPTDLAPGLPMFFDAVAPGEALLVTRDEGERGELHSVRCEARETR